MDKNPYRHDGRADKDRRADSHCHNESGRRNGRVVKRLNYWPYTSSVRVRVLQGRIKKNLSECMRFGCRLPIAVVSQTYLGNAEI